jgi:chromosome segregation protein
MFKLQRLEITGFKSFADYTDLVFTGNGITGIVGPNGCGKSNVADAIAWVLGEQKVKNLRGGEMKDVIFQGSKNRSPSGMAEVVLHMVRDETIEEEPDIEDIDATLEELDDQAGAVEDRLSPELEALAPQPAAAPSDATATAQPASRAATGAPVVEAPAEAGEATQALAVVPADSAAVVSAPKGRAPLARRRGQVRRPSRPRTPSSTQCASGRARSHR